MAVHDGRNVLIESDRLGGGGAGNEKGPQIPKHLAASHPALMPELLGARKKFAAAGLISMVAQKERATALAAAPTQSRHANAMTDEL